MKAGHTMLLFVLLFYVVTSQANDCPMPGCICSTWYIECPDNVTVLHNLTDGTNNRFTGVKIESRDLHYIGDHVLPPNLTDVYIQRVDNFTMSVNALKGSADTLECFEVAYGTEADFTKALRLLNNLDYFRVAYTKVTNWDLLGLSKIGSTVTSLYLENVGLTTWPQWLNRFHFLKTLWISNTPLQKIPENALHGLRNILTSVKLEYGKLTEIPKAVTKLQKLSYLSLSINEISDTHDLVYGLLPFEQTLETLHIDNNLLTELPRLHFLVKLKEVYIYYNNINDSTSGSLPPSLTTLYINGNKLKRVPKVVSGLPNLEFIYLNSNLISVIKKSDFPLNSSLSTLNLGSNPITNIPNDAFDNLGPLLQLYLYGTKIARVPIALKSLVNLNYLNVQDCSNLICTCNESSLKDYFASRPNLKVYGNCGVENVKHFFTTLVKKCP